MQQTRSKQYAFMFNVMYHIVLLMSYIHTNNKQYFLRVPLILVL